jgi:formate dehydrogenase subunit gamma
MSGKVEFAPLSEVELSGITRLIARLADRPGVLIEILHGVQDLIGYVPDQAVPLLATALNLSRAEVHGVVTFYHYFRRAPGGRRTLRVCRAEACQSMNGRAIEAQARRTLGIEFGETTADGAFSLDAVYCLGLCACAPAVMLDGNVYGRVTPQRLEDLIAGPAA